MKNIARLVFALLFSLPWGYSEVLQYKLNDKEIKGRDIRVQETDKANDLVFVYYLKKGILLSVPKRATWSISNEMKKSELYAKSSQDEIISIKKIGGKDMSEEEAFNECRNALEKEKVQRNIEQIDSFTPKKGRKSIRTVIQLPKEVKGIETPAHLIGKKFINYYSFVKNVKTGTVYQYHLSFYISSSEELQKAHKDMIFFASVGFQPL